MASIEGAVRQFCCLLESSEDDLDKIAALSLASEHLQKDECDSKCKISLFKSIGYDFLSRMLLGRLDIPGNEDDSLTSSVAAYRKTALTILTAFCIECEIVRDSDFLRMTPHVLKLFQDLNDESVTEDVFQYFKSIVLHNEGRLYLEEHNVIKEIVKLYSSTKNDQIVDLILLIARSVDVWRKNSEAYNKLMLALCIEFDKDSSRKKFVLCDKIRHIMLSKKIEVVDIEEFSQQKWPQHIRNGLRDILTSRIDDYQRNPALKLASTLSENFGLDWALIEGDNPTQFQLVLIHLSSIEIRMQLEDQPVDSILKNAELIVACFTLLEVAIVEFVENRISVPKDQMISSFSEATNAVLATLSTFAKETHPGSKLFCYAMIKFISVGSVEDVLSIDGDISDIMPFVLKQAEESYAEYKSWCDDNVTGNLSEEVVDLFLVLLPSMRRLTSSEKGRIVIWSRIELFLDYFDFHWKIVSLGGDIAQTRGKNAREALIGLCDLLIETIIAEPGELSNLPAIVDRVARVCVHDEHKPVALSVPVVILGLVSLKRLEVVESDPNVVAIVKSASTLLAHYADVESFDAAAVPVGKSIKPNTKLWLNLKDYILVGNRSLLDLWKNSPWIGEHIEAADEDLYQRLKKQLTSQQSV